MHLALFITEMMQKKKLNETKYLPTIVEGLLNMKENSSLIALFEELRFKIMSQYSVFFIFKHIFYHNDCLECKYKLYGKMIGLQNRQGKTRSQKQLSLKKQPQYIVLVSERLLRRFKVHQDVAIGISRKYGSKVREMVIDEDNKSSDEIIKQGQQRSIQNLKKQLTKLRQSKRSSSLWKKEQASTIISETRSYSLDSH